MDWLDKHSNATAALSEIAFEINGLAKAFHIIGNDAMYKTLVAIAGDMHEATKDARDALTESITESINRSAESSKTLLAASLAGIMIAKREHDRQS